MSGWVPSLSVRTPGGYHRILARPPGHHPMDITFVRDAPLELASYATADPFGDATAQLNLSMLTVFDDPGSPELAFLRDDTLIDIWWIPAMAVPEGWVVIDRDTARWTNPLTQQADLICPAYEYTLVGGVPVRSNTRRGTKVWEGQVASFEVEDDDDRNSQSLQCQGALFQVDLTLAKPYFPARPRTLESLIVEAFDHDLNPSLKTSPARIKWPDGWSRVAPSWDGVDSIFRPNVKPGKKWTGYTARNTGSWDHKLTSYIQNLLAVMIVKPGSGMRAGSQWTLMNAVEGDPDHPRGRTPVLQVRNRFAAPAFSIWAGAFGVKLNLTRDLTQAENVIYGTGTDRAGTTWRNAVIDDDGSRTDYRPLAWSKLSYPAHHNPALQRSRFLRESYVQYSSGISQLDATDSAALTLDRGIDAGWTGSVTLSVDPSVDLSRWQIRAGMPFRLKGFRGTDQAGTIFHISACEASPAEGTVTLTVDTRFRDLITVQEAIARTRDALTPAKLLQLNRNSNLIEDLQAPWDYHAGSGFVPRDSRRGYFHMPQREQFPYTDWLTNHPPESHPGFYVPCHAGATNSQNRWSGPVQILMAEKGTIRRTEIFCVDRRGHLVKDKFHFSLWYSNGINAAAMPNNGKIWSPFINGAFESIDPKTGQPWIKPGVYAPNQGAGLVIGWGNYAQPAGYSPGLASEGDNPTGLLVDESTWTWDCSVNNNNYEQLAAAGGEKRNVISLYAMFYSEHGSPVYFGGRLYRQNPGTE